MFYAKKRLTQRVVSADGKTFTEVRSEVMVSIEAENDVQQSIEVTVSTSSGASRHTASHSTADYSHE
ncbi:hypothetical protein [Phormidesmis priestleyi]